MAERIAEIVILAEDLAQANLIRRYLQRCGHGPFRTVLCERGSGEQHVRTRYPAELSAYRRNAAKRRSALAVVIDADTNTVTERESELSAALQQAGEPRREDHEAVSLLIPKRNIETWMLCLNGEAVDELTDYSKRRDTFRLTKGAAATLYSWTRPNAQLPANCVASLRSGIREIRRIAPA